VVNQDVVDVVSSPGQSRAGSASMPIAVSSCSKMRYPHHRLSPGKLGIQTFFRYRHWKVCSWLRLLKNSVERIVAA